MSEAFTWHGGRLNAARAHFGERGEPWIDLSTGINPCPWPNAGAHAADWRALPDTGMLHDLEHVAARYFGVDPQNICALPGSEIGLRLLPTVLPLPGYHIGPTYRTHSDIYPHPCAPGDIEGNGGESRAILLANPNNPDGRVRASGEMRQWLNRVEASGSWLIVDEAFADAAPGISLSAEIADARPLVIFRSFGKFFGLAGLRLGFVLGPASIVRAYRRLLGDWPIHTDGLTIGLAAYGDAEWIAKARSSLAERAERLDMLLRRHGYRPIGDCPLFRLIDTPDAGRLFDRLAGRAILTRPFDYAPGWLRIGLPGEESAWRRLDRALADG